jgi:glycosyltransferase involved in cell wall biosynthesis
MARISLVLPFVWPVGGAETVCLTLAQEFIARGHHVEILSFAEKAPAPPSAPKNVEFTNLNAGGLRTAVVPMTRHFSRTKPDAIVANMWPFNCVTLVAARLGSPKAAVLAVDHNTLSLKYSGKGKMHRRILASSMAILYPSAKRLVAVSSGVADDLAQISGLSRQKWTVINNPLTLNVASPEETARAEPLWNGYRGKRVLAVGTMKKQKNYPLMLRAFAKVVARMDAKLMIAGAGQEESLIRQTIAELNLGAHVILAGFVDQPASLYGTADLFVLSSDYEGFGNVILEALASGLPVVSTDCKSGPAEILENGRYGRLSPVGDADALASNMCAALETPHDKNMLRARADAFQPNAIAGKYLELMFPS